MESSPQKSKLRRKATNDEDEEVVFEGDPDDYEDIEEIQIEDFKEAPTKFEDTKLEVTDPLEEINFGSLEEPRVTYVSSLLQGELKEKVVHTLKKFKYYFAWSFKEGELQKWSTDKGIFSHYMENDKKNKTLM